MGITKYFAGLASGAALAVLLNGCAMQEVRPVDAEALAQLQDGCTFYTNILKLVDEKHVNGVTTTKHEVMAEGAKASIIKHVAWSKLFDRKTESFDESKVHFKPGSEKQKLEDREIEFLTLGGQDIAVIPPETPLASYADQCGYFQDAILTLRDATGMDVRTLFGFAVQGALQVSRDPHTQFMLPDQAKDLMTQVAGELGGIGIEMGIKDGSVEVVDSFEDGPAAKAGLLKGDLITAIDTKPVADMTPKEIIDAIRGKPGTKVVLTIKRGGAEPFAKTVIRDNVIVKSAKGRLIGDKNDTAHVVLKTFSMNTINDVLTAIGDVDREAETHGTRIEKLILSLANNQGGLMDPAIGLSDLFVAADGNKPFPIFSYGKTSADNQYIVDTVTPAFSTPEGDFYKIPLDADQIAVVQNHNSASSSEIVAAALQDSGVAVTGGFSFGKGTAQTVYPTSYQGEPVRQMPTTSGKAVYVTKDRFIPESDLFGAVKITNAFLFPGSSGLSDQGGVVPNVLVKYNDFRDKQVKDAKRETALDHALTIPVKTRVESMRPGKECALKPEFSGALSADRIKSIPEYLVTEAQMPDDKAGGGKSVKVLNAALACTLQNFGDKIPYTVTGPWSAGPQKP